MGNMGKVEDSKKTQLFPDGTPVGEWFSQAEMPDPDDLGRRFTITEYGVKDDGEIYTEKIQALIDKAHDEGGGVIVVPQGVYMTGALFFKQGVHLYICDGGVLKGSDDITDYPVCLTRIEGETCLYYPALINADGIDGFTMLGGGTIDGNGMRSWRAFWQRRKWNEKCTNKDEQRPRLVYISNCTNVKIAGLTMQNSHYWTTHIYRCRYVKYINCRILSPVQPVRAPSTDAIDIDVCTDVHIKDCYFAVNDDSVVLKGGKGPWADEAPENGSNERVIIEDCTYGFCHSCLTCGSESVHNRNIIMRRIKADGPYNLLWIKLRPDTPQHYEYINIEGAEGKIRNFIYINRWTQFFDLQGRSDIPKSRVNNITMKDCKCDCETFFNVTADEDRYELSDFVFENLDITAKNGKLDLYAVGNMRIKDITVKEI